MNQLTFSADEALACRLLQFLILSGDAGSDAAKVGHLATVRTSSQALNVAVNDGHGGEAGDGPSQDEARKLLTKLATSVRDDLRPFVLLEGYAGAVWPKGSQWAADRTALLAHEGRALDPAFTMTPARELVSRFEKARKRLAGHALSPKVRLGLVGGTVVATLASGGLATALGAAIGGSMGLSGAAATSAGLAWLGGGSLAAGGFGMAGGTILVGASVKVTLFGASTVAKTMASHSAVMTVTELAKLDYTCTVRPEMAAEVVQHLDALVAELRADPQPTKETARSIRAVEAEVRHLRDSTTQRRLRAVTKIVPLAPLDTAVDRLSRWSDSKSHSD